MGCKYEAQINYDLGGVYRIVYNHQDKEVGELCFKFTTDEKIYIPWIGIDSKYRGRGFGTELIKFLFNLFPNDIIELMVAEGNIRAEKLYKKLGFKFVDWDSGYTIMQKSPNKKLEVKE